MYIPALILFFLPLVAEAQLVPTVDLVVPTEGPMNGSQLITINGSGFDEITQVFIDGMPVSFDPITPNAISIITPGGYGPVTVEVVSPAGSATGSYTYLSTPVPPTVIGVNSNVGSTSGGEIVFIGGSGFILDNTSVQFGVNPVPPGDIHVTSESTLTAIAPPGSLGTVHIVVSTPAGGASIITPADEYIYANVIPNAPIVNHISPNFGPTSGGNEVGIFGANFSNTPVHVFFGNVESTNVALVEDYLLVATVPPGIQEVVDVTVESPFGTSPIVHVDQYTYVASVAPVLAQVYPNYGPVEGGNQITIKGEHFVPDALVTFSGEPATDLIFVDSQTLYVTAPAAAATALVSVSTPFGETAEGATLEYLHTELSPAAPEVERINPLPDLEGRIRIIGNNFSPESRVAFGGVLVEAEEVTVLSPREILAVAPANTFPIGTTVDVTVTTAVETSLISPADQFTFISPIPAQPLQFIGKIQSNKYLNKTTYFLLATWEPSFSSDVIAYRIYKGDCIVEQIPSNAPPIFKRQLSSKRAKGYSIVAVNSSNIESLHTPLRVCH